VSGTGRKAVAAMELLRAAAVTACAAGGGTLAGLSAGPDRRDRLTGAAGG